jgi:hypothetical protein
MINKGVKDILILTFVIDPLLTANSKFEVEQLLQYPIKHQEYGFRF